jgi:hypothetical protein
MMLADETASILQSLGVSRDRFARGSRVVHSPLTGEAIGQLDDSKPEAVGDAVANAQDAFLRWRSVPAPGAASWSGSSVRSCAPQRIRSAVSLRSRPARLPPKAAAKSRR